ncbi:unnamed protein product, partial [marine sediment metagenome]
ETKNNLEPAWKKVLELFYKHNIQFFKKANAARVLGKEKGLAKKGLVGQGDNDFKEIFLCKHYKSKRARARSEIEETFMHEILHT